MTSVILDPPTGVSTSAAKMQGLLAMTRAMTILRSTFLTDLGLQDKRPDILAYRNLRLFETGVDAQWWLNGAVVAVLLENLSADFVDSLPLVEQAYDTGVRISVAADDPATWNLDIPIGQAHYARVVYNKGVYRWSGEVCDE